MQAYQPPLQDPEAFSQLYDHTHLIIFRFIYGMHGGPLEEVEDLTCDTYLRAWKGRLRFKGGEQDALCWLFTIARRLVIDAHRHQKAQSNTGMLSLDETNFDVLPPLPQTTPEEQVSSREQFTHLWQIMQRLPDDRREMLVLRYMLGWKVREIAEYVHMEENTISVYIKRSLEQIRRAWLMNE